MGSQRVRHDWVTFTSYRYMWCVLHLLVKLTSPLYLECLDYLYVIYIIIYMIEFKTIILLFVFYLCHLHLFSLFLVFLSFFVVKWSCSVVSDSAIPWTVAHQAPPSMGFSRQEYWSGVPLPSLPQCTRVSFSSRSYPHLLFGQARISSIQSLSSVWLFSTP